MDICTLDSTTSPGTSEVKVSSIIKIYIEKHLICLGKLPVSNSSPNFQLADRVTFIATIHKFCFHVLQFVHDISFSSFFAFLDDDDDNEDDYDNSIMIPRTGTIKLL